MGYLSPHFSVEELSASEYAARHGIDNSPPQEVVSALGEWCVNLGEPVRRLLGVPLVVRSGYRSPKVNRAVGGAKTSAHLTGYAVDLVPAGMPLAQAMGMIVESGLHYDQCILEYANPYGGGWIHLGWKGPKGVQRRESLRTDRPGEYVEWRP